MANDRLRAAILTTGVTIAELAELTGVDPKTVERWVGGRLPYRRHRYAIASKLGQDEDYLWPHSRSADEIAGASESEIVTVYPHRWAVPRETLGQLFDDAEEEIGILVYSGFFLTDDGGLRSLLARKAAAGVDVRILLGDPASPAVALRSQEEGLGEDYPAMVRNAISRLRQIQELEGVEIRLHGTTLYNSLYRADDQLLVNCHIYGTPAESAPVLHLRQLHGGDMVKTYLQSFERVWAGSRPME
jgi:transcriptional regulator with XRE-family HTH domain